MLFKKKYIYFHISAGTCTHGRMCVYGRYTPAKPVVNSEKKNTVEDISKDNMISYIMFLNVMKVFKSFWRYLADFDQSRIPRHCSMRVDVE